MPSTVSPRLDYLDAVRAFALLLGILFHASLSFSPVFFGWAVMDISTSPLINHFMLISHSFRMELFFLIAGYFSHLTLHKKGAQAFLQSRLLRIALPLLCGWLILRPLIVSGWVMGAESLQGEVNIVAGLLAGVARLESFPHGFLTGTHLWFLYYLLIFTGVLLAVRLVTQQVAAYFTKPLQYATRSADIIMGWLCRSSMGLSVLACTSLGCLWFMSHWGVDTPDQALRPHIPATILYGSFFLFGWLLQRQSVLIDNFSKITGEKIFTCIFSIAVCIKLSSFQMQTTHEYYAWIKLTFLLGYASMMWTLVALSIGVAKKLFNQPNRVVRYLADAAYWLYLIHLPIVVWLQVAFAELPLHWGIKWVLISWMTIGLSLFLYEIFVRSTWLGKLLNGYKAEPTIQPQRKHSAA